MTRKQVGSLAVIAIAVLIISLIAVITIPLWVTVLMVRPGIIEPLSQKATQAGVKYMAKQMFSRGGPPTQPMRKAGK